MNEDFDDLKQQYQAIRAPSHLATRIRASVDDRNTRGHSWLPVTAVAMAAIVAVWVLPFTWQGVGINTPTPGKPSLSTLASLKPDKPAVSTPTLSQVKTVRIPGMPSRPVPKKPQSGIQIDYYLMKENEHALI